MAPASALGGSWPSCRERLSTLSQAGGIPREGMSPEVGSPRRWKHRLNPGRRGRWGGQPGTDPHLRGGSDPKLGEGTTQGPEGRALELTEGAVPALTPCVALGGPSGEPCLGRGMTSPAEGEPPQTRPAGL